MKTIEKEITHAQHRSHMRHLPAHQTGANDARRLQSVRAGADLGKLPTQSQLHETHASRSGRTGQASGMAGKRGRCTPACTGCEKHDYIIMPPQGYTLTYRKDGMTQWEYAVRPDNAGFMAAAMASRAAMEDEIRRAATYRPCSPVKFTKKELAYIERFKAEMGMRYPNSWTQNTAFEIVQAGIDAVRGDV